MQMRVYKYRLRAPTKNAELVDEQMQRRHQYRNVLVDLERARREAYRQIVLRFGDIRCMSYTKAWVAKELSAARQALKAERAEARKRVRVPELEQRIKELVEHNRAVKKDLKEAKQALKDDAAAQEEIRILNEHGNTYQKLLRRHSGLYWGTYLRVEEAMQQARAELYDPVYCRWTGFGEVAVQIQNGLPTDKLVGGTDTRIQIDPYTRKSKDRVNRTAFRMRIGSEGRSPIWAEWPVTAHRPLPEGKIKWAYVQRHRRGRKFFWYLYLVVAIPDHVVLDRGGDEGTVAVHFGWRRKLDGHRVAYWVDDKGAGGEFLLPTRALERARKVSDLASIRDRTIEEIRPKMVEWIAQQKAAFQWMEDREIPRWFLDRTRNLGKWRAAARFAALAIAWRRQRWAGDEEGFEMLEAWRQQDAHLLDWQEAQRQNVLNARMEFYRLWAVELSRKYKTLIVDATDFSTMARRPLAESDKVHLQAVGHQRTQAAPSLLRETLIDAFAKRRGIVVKKQIPYLTQTCNSCGHCEEWDSAGKIRNQCPSCLKVWDQDRNVCLQMLADYDDEGSAEKAA